MQKTLHSLEDTHVFAAEIAGSLRGGEVLGLEGELGTGKTEFVRGLAEALGSRDTVKSPSFTLLNHYRLEHPTIKHLIHVDLYRLEYAGSNLISQIGLDEWLDRNDTIIAIEWPEHLASLTPITQRLLFSYGTHETERIVKKEEALPRECKSL